MGACPSCAAPDTRRHCGDGHPTCTWVRCAGCKSIVDAKGRSMPDRTAS